ncbi:MAG TPA: hypothetical protein VF450_09000 [Noviherbaspirillum sp.]
MRSILIAVLALLLTACATPYQPFELFGRGGYSDKKISENVYQVAYYGNGATNMGTLNSLLMYRTAEITLDHGFDYFEVLNGQARIPMSAYGGFKSVEHTVKLYKGQPANSTSRFHVARKVKEEFGPYIGQQK